MSLRSRRRSPFLARFRSRLPGSGRAWRSLAAALALLACAGAAPAQTSVKLVSNTGQTAATTLASVSYAQAFTTGSNSAGYALTRVDYKFKRSGMTPITLANITVEIRQNSSGIPGALVATLTDPASLPSDGLAQFTAAGDGIELAAGTTYFAVVVTSGLSTDQLHVTTSDAEDTGAATGWSIADSHLWSSKLIPTWTDATTDTDSMMIAIHGYALAPKLVGNTSRSVSGGQFANSDWAQPFTTGSHASGYKLTRAEIRMLGGSGTAPTYTASIHSDSSNSPGTSLGTLTNPAAWPSSAGLARHFAPSGGIDLAANTTYWLVFDITANPSSSMSDWQRYRTVQDQEDPGASTGWTIGNGGRERTWNTTTWGSVGIYSLILSLHGNPKPPPMVSNTGQTLTNEAGFAQDRAQQFTTGSGTGGYTLNAVALRLKSSAGTAPVYSVSIQGDSSDLPDGTSLGTLTSSATLTASFALVEFAASGSGIALTADTNYWVVVDVSTGDANTKVQGGVVPNEDEGALPGWSIGNGHRWRLNSASAWEANASTVTLGIAVYGTSADQAAPAFQSARVNGTALSVTFNENLYSGSAPAGSAFALSGGRSGTGTATISGATVSVTLGTAVPPGASVTLGYTPPASGKLRDNAGNLAASFTGQPVINPAAPPPPPVTPPPDPQQPPPPPPPPPATRPGAPERLTAVGGDGQAELSWSAPVRPAVSFHDTAGEPVAAESVVDVTGDLTVAEDGSLTVHTVIEPLGELTIATHGRGELVSGSVRVVTGSPVGGLARYRVPGAGVAVAGASPAVREVLFPARRQEGGINTGAAIHNREEEALGVSCRLMSGGMALEEAEIPLEANGQASWFLEDVFTAADTSDFLGAVHCTVPGVKRFHAIAVETDAAQRIFTALPTAAADRTGGGDGETVLVFPHFANGTWTTDLVFVNLSIEAAGRPRLTPFHPDILPSRPEIYFQDSEGALVPPASLVDLTDDLEVTEDGALTVRAEMEPLGVLTISTHGRGELVTGSVRVVSEGPIGGMLRFAHPALGAAGMGSAAAVRDAMVPARRREGGVNTRVALHNLESSSSLLRCELLQAGVPLGSASIPLAANGQTSWTIDQAFPATDTSDFTGSVRCAATAGGSFSAAALETDPGARTITTLPVVEVE